MIHRYHIQPHRIINFNNNLITLPKLDLLLYFHNKSRISPPMRSYEPTINIYLTTGSNTLEPKIQPFLMPFCREYICLTIISYSLIKIISFHLHISCIPSVGQCYFFPYSLPYPNSFHYISWERPFFKLPSIIKRKNIPSHSE